MNTTTLRLVTTTKNPDALNMSWHLAGLDSDRTLCGKAHCHPLPSLSPKVDHWRKLSGTYCRQCERNHVKSK